jgi:hypothetical protein
MGRVIRAAALLLLLASCGLGGASPPRNVENACAIVRERPHYLRALQDTSRRWGVPVHVQMAIIYHESSFDGDARTPYRFILGFIPAGRRSSAYGYAQALDGTWDDYRKETGRRSARRDRISDATDFMGWYMDKTEESLGISKSDAANQYLAYHEGRRGYARGTHNGKPWLINVSRRVESRAARYRDQLDGCRV